MATGNGYLTTVSTIFQLYRGGCFNVWRKPEYTEKVTKLMKTHNQTTNV